MRFEDVLGRYGAGRLSCEEAADVLGMSVSSFYRWRQRHEAEGAAGLADRRLGKVSARRAPVDEVSRVLELFETRYFDFSVKHFHEKLLAIYQFLHAAQSGGKSVPVWKIACRLLIPRLKKEVRLRHALRGRSCGAFFQRGSGCAAHPTYRWRQPSEGRAP